MKAVSPKSLNLFQRDDGTPRRVLYAEDQTTSRVVTKAMLERMGFIVDAVEDGELAVQCARNDNYDVILLDIEMPVMDGVTAARSIRAEALHCADTPILALSAFLADSTEHSDWRDAFDSAVPKPANSNELLKAMTKAVAFKTARAKIIPTILVKQDLVKALQETLSPSMWGRVENLVGEEMSHLLNTIGAGEEAGDGTMAQRARKNLKSLAESFGAVEVASVAGNESVAILRATVERFTRSI